MKLDYSALPTKRAQKRRKCYKDIKMATKRRPIRPNVPLSGTNMNFRPPGGDLPRSEAKGTRPTAPPSSIREIFVMMILHVCKKTIFFDTNLKVALYLGSLFIVSLIGDFIPFPKTYFARSDNLFNVFFVKIGWGWTLLFTVPFLVMTSYTLCCGDMKKLLRHHAPRIVIATFFWFFWTKLFNLIETSYGKCTVRSEYIYLKFMEIKTTLLISRSIRLF